MVQLLPDGSSAGDGVPKQYLRIGKRTVIECTLSRLDSANCFAGVVVVLNAEDAVWPTLSVELHTPMFTTTGGDERMHSVLNGLLALEDKAAANDWVLVHDVVRPCVRQADILTLMKTLREHDSGGLLVSPIRETLKQAAHVHDDNNGVAVAQTLDRNGYRLAATPQMFRYDKLKAALQGVIADGATVTDEAQAMELAGYPVMMLDGAADNIKITFPEDLLLAEFILARQAHD